MATDDTIFHKIIRKEIAAKIVFEDDLLVAFRDISPQAPTHILVVPRKNLASLREVSPVDKELLGHMLTVCSELARDEGLSESGYRVVINAGEDGGQTVYQLHMHLLGGRKLTWPPG